MAAHARGFVAGVLLATLMAPEGWTRSLLRPHGGGKWAAPV
jgi:membrane associated rhomboid family serine protease